MIPRQFISVNIKTYKFKIRNNFQLFPLTTIGSKDLDFSLNEMLNSLHLSGLSCILFSTDHIDTESAIFWALLIECLDNLIQSKKVFGTNDHKLIYHLLLAGNRRCQPQYLECSEEVCSQQLRSSRTVKLFSRSVFKYKRPHDNRFSYPDGKHNIQRY